MKSTSFIALAVSTLIASTSAIPHLNNIFGRGAGDTCHTAQGEGYCKRPRYCKGISSAGDKYCGGKDTQCCVELTCKVTSGTGYCRSVQSGCPNGTFQQNDHDSKQWPCFGDGIQCCVPKSETPPPPETTESIGNNTGSPGNGTENLGGDGTLPQIAVDMLKELEGFRGSVYKDQVGVDTIGYGHNCQTAPGTCEKLKQPISEKEAEQLMLEDLKQFEECVCELPNASGLNSNQFAALVSFAFNTGCFGTRDHFADVLNKGNYQGICDAIKKTNTLDGILNSRRDAEAKLCNTSVQRSCGCKGKGHS